MLFYDWILEPAILTYSLYYFFPSSSLVAHLFTQDSVSSSLRYLLSHLGLPIQHTTIFTLTKVLIFLSLSTFYYLSKILTWGNFPYVYLYYLITLLTTPVILEHLFHKTKYYSQQLQNYQKRTLNHFGCICLAKSINHICQTNLNSNPKITATELEQVANLNDMTYIWTFLKILLTTTIIKYVKKSGSMWGNVLQMLYDTGNLIEVPKNQSQSIIISPSQTKSRHNRNISRNTSRYPTSRHHPSRLSNESLQPHNPKKILSEIVMKRKWYYFYDPNVLNMIIKIYQEGESTFLQDALISLQTQTLRFFTLWTLSNIIPLPIIAFILRLRDENIPYNLSIPIIDSALVILFPQHIAKIAFFSEFIEYLNNPGILTALQKSLTTLVQNTRILFRETRYNRFLFLSIPTILFFSQFTTSKNLPNPDHFPRLPYLSHLIDQLPTKLITFSLIILTTKYNFIYLWLSIFGYFSDYSLPHLVTLNIILYLLVNIFNIHNIEEPQVKIDVIKSYWSGRPTETAKTTHHLDPQHRNPQHHNPQHQINQNMMSNNHPPDRNSPINHHSHPPFSNRISNPISNPISNQIFNQISNPPQLINTPLKKEDIKTSFTRRHPLVKSIRPHKEETYLSEIEYLDQPMIE